MMLRRVLMVLSASLEFERGHNSEVQMRESDNFEVPLLIKRLPNLGENNKERPLCFEYSVKARCLLHAHLTRLPLPPATLEVDRSETVFLRHISYNVSSLPFTRCIQTSTFLH